MNISKESMIKLGFKKYGEIWQHHTRPDLKYKDRSWVGLVSDIYVKGYNQGKRDCQAAIREALDIR
jgi:hypothetical protein